MPIELLIHNFGYICSALIALIIGLFIFIKDTSKRSYQLLFLTALSYALYCSAYLFAVNAFDSDTSTIFAFLMVVAIATPCLNAHLAFTTFNIEKEHKNGLTVMYLCMVFVIGFFVLHPFGLRLESAPKAYFPNFFVPGPYYWLYLFFFFIVLGYFFTVLIKLYKRSSPQEQNRLKYFFAGFGWGYMCSLPIYMLILNMPGSEHLMVFTPIMGLYTLPLAYGVYKYDLLNISIAIKNAVLYAFFIIFVGGSIVAINLLNSFFTSTYTGLPSWVIPIGSVFMILVVSAIIWNQLRQTDLLKYEFINNISHKFRTPLTHIRWLASELPEMNDPHERDKAAAQIDFASMRLFELTNAVINASRDVNTSLYRFSDVSLKNLLADIQKAHVDQVMAKELQVQVQFDSTVPETLEIQADNARLRFALQILYENALMYTHRGGSVLVHASIDAGANELIIQFTDDGIGIKESDLPHVFSRFFRATNARRMDTEGMGLGLYIAKDIIEKHGGRIWAESGGENKGSKFTVALTL